MLVTLGEQAGWQDFAYLAAVPASFQVNQGAGAAIALEAKGGIPREVDDCLRRLKPAGVCHLGEQPLAPAPAHGKALELSATSAQQAAVLLAETFWKSSQRVVLCRDDDYASALMASTLAARLRSPLLYVGAAGISPPTAAIFQKLQIREAVFVGEPPASLGTKGLVGARDVLVWLKEKGMACSYHAVVNVRDRKATTIQRLSLAAPMFAAANDGMVVPIDLAIQWRTPFSGKPLAGELPKGVKAGAKPPTAGVIELPEGKVPFVRGYGANDKQYRLWLDLNGDGAYDGSGEGPWQQDAAIALFGKTRAVSFCEKFGIKADLSVTTGTPEEVNELLKPLHAVAGAPRALCLVGLPDALPQAIRAHGNEDMPSDLPYANTDADLFSEIAVGRIIAESASFATLHASRCATYAHLLDPSWAGRAGQARWEKGMGAAFENVGLDASAYHDTEHLAMIAPPPGKKDAKPQQAKSFSQDSPLASVAFLTHMAHSWWVDIGQTYDRDSATLLAPTVVESGGCLTGSLDEPGFRSVVSRLLRNGAICFVGQTRPGIAPQEQQRVEFWNGLFAGETLGEAHLRAQNSKTALVLETNQARGGADFYQLHIRTLFGDPGFKPRFPAAPRSAAVRYETTADGLVVHAPQSWWISQMRVPEDWKLWADKPLYAIRGLGTYPKRHWCGDQFDLEEDCIDVRFTTGRRIASIEPVQSLPAPLGWTGKQVVDEHADGTRTYHWRVRLMDFDQKSGKIVNQADRLELRVKYE
ncbi:MAG TPA: C25 family cysteine peptidase [Luteolibacter sp.]|nr:C25 family cysteine peptidase [Luteolibacter sp.]